MNFDFIKKYIKIQNQVNLASSYESVKDIAEQYTERIISLDHHDLQKVLDSYNLGGSSGVYLTNYKQWKIDLDKKDIKQQHFFSNNIDLVVWVEDNFELLKNCGGLDIFIELEKLKVAIILLHYQGHIILKVKQ
jgi:hypothetical protein